MSDSVISTIKAAGVGNRQNILRQMLDDCARWKPGGSAYDGTIARRRDYLAGRQQDWLRAELQTRYPNTHQEISAYVVPLFPHLCRQRATVYRVPPTRKLSTGEDATARMRGIYDAASLDHVLQRAEQTAAACGLVFLRAAWDAIDQRVSVSQYWPDRVHAALDPNRPADIQAARFVLAQIVSEAGVNIGAKDVRRYELWERRDDGWTRTLVDSNGEFLQPSEFDRQTLFPALPFAALHYDLPESTLFEMPSDDDIVVNDALNVACSDQMHTVARQSFNQLCYSGPDLKAGQITVGVGDVLRCDPGGTWTAIAYNPQIAQVTELLRERIGQHLILNAVSPSSASANPSYTAGVALRTANQPMLEAREARLPVIRDFETRRLWPLVRLAAASGNVRVDGDMVWEPGPIELPLDDEMAWRLAEGRVAANVSTWPDEMVKMNLAPDVEAARRLYEESKEYNAQFGGVTAAIPFVKDADPGRPVGDDEDRSPDADA